MNEQFFEDQLSLLNEAQRQVVEEIYWPIMVVAWPWTWKTQIIALRTANIILKAWINPENILITTFTEAWVIAIKNRLVKFIWTDAYKVKVSTIHSFAQDVITSFPEKFSEQKAWSTIDDIESLEVLTNILDENIKSSFLEYLFTPFDRYLYLRDIKDRIWKLKWEWISPQRFENIIQNLRNEYDQKLEELKSNKRIRDLEKRTAKDSETYKKHIWKLNELNFIYKEYIKYLNQNSLYDFSDMINFVVDKFKIDEDLRTFYAEKYQFIMLDEYQDTNNPQNEIMDLILSASPFSNSNKEEKIIQECNIMVVWDDDQSIYRFQGANIENMLDFYVKYPETKFIVLENNYRSTQSILDLATNLIKNNKERLVNRLDFLEKKLISQINIDSKEKKENYYILWDELIEKIFVLEDIKKKQKIPQSQPLPINGTMSPTREKGAEQKEQETFAIIVRSNREVEEWSNFMQEQWIEVESKLKTNILTNKFVNFILDFLKLVENPNFNDEKLINILRTDIIDVENIDVINITRELYRKNYSKSGFNYTLWDIIKNIDKVNSTQKENIRWEIINQKDSTNLEFIDEQERKSVSVFELEMQEKYKNYEKIVNFRNLILELNSELWMYGISRLFQKIIDKIWIIDYIEINWNFSDLEDIFTLFNKIKQFNEQNKDLTLNSLLNKFELHKKYNIAISRQILKKSNSNIEILTAHSSKWLEYDYVYIPWVYWWNWDNKKVMDKLKLPIWVAWQWLQYTWLDEKELNNLEKSINEEEDRRLFFVAITRAKKELTFTRPAWKDKKPYIDSPFMVEIMIESQNIENQISEDIIEKSIKKQLSNNNNTLINNSIEELNYIKEFLETYKLSSTDLNIFLEDPKLFLQNVVFKYPFVDNEFTIFGKIYHRALELATQKKLEWENVELWYLTETFLYLLDRQVLTHEEKNRLTKKGIEWLTGYFEHFKNNKRIPLFIEYNFRPKNIVFEWIPITWKIDKIEKLFTITNNNLESSNENIKSKSQSSLFLENVAVVDYKTWSIKTEANIKWTDRYWDFKEWFDNWKYYRQLLFYKLLAENDIEFHSKYNISELALDFVEWKNSEYKYVSVNCEQEDFEEFKILVKESFSKINNLDFWKEVLGK